MRTASDRLYPIVRAIYGVSPMIDMHTRIKVGLKKLGIIENAAPRPPLLKVKPDIEAAISKIILKSNLVG
jgi:4-hydroxy-tetrahydrodipicolinate synthase